MLWDSNPLRVAMGGGETAMSSEAVSAYRQEQVFYLRLAVGITIFTVFSFAQWALRGYADYAAAPVAVHIHSIAMLCWLGLFITQNYLAGKGSLELHRKLGWLGVVLAIFVAVMGTYVTTEAVALHRVPPIFTAPYFLVMGPIHTYFFLGTLAAAVAMRRNTEWHRRFMLVATVLILEPPIGRIVPLPVLASPLGPWVELLLQIGLLAIAMVYDRKVRGSVHPAYWWGVGILTACVATIVALSTMHAVSVMAASYAGG